MKINKSYKLWKACAKDSDRPALECIHFVSGYAYASNAHILAKVEIPALFSLEEYELADSDKLQRAADLLSGFCLSSSTYKLLASFPNVEVTTDINEVEPVPIFVTTMGQNQVVVKCKKSGLLNTPNFEATLKTTEERIPIEKIALNTALLADLGEAIGIDSVRMDFTQANQKIFIHGNNPDMYDAWGIIMPQVITQSLPGFES